MEQTEIKIKIEAEILTLKRELKYITENLTWLKADTNEIIATKERVTLEISERNDELNKILNEISDEKLKWALERQAQMDELAEKNSQAENILKRKAELNEQEEKIRQIELSDIEIRNETRRLELKNLADKTASEAILKQIEEDRNTLNEERTKNLQIQEDFKLKLSELIKSYE